MGTNFYLDQGEGDNYYNYPHIGKIYFSENHGLSFIFYKSKIQQLSILESLSYNEQIVDEYGNKTDIQSFVNRIINLPYTEKEFEFI